MIQIYHCLPEDNAQGLDFLPGILYLKKKGEVCFYNFESGIFYTPDLNSIDIRGKVIIPHNDLTIMEIFHSKIIEAGGIIPGEIEQNSRVDNWIDSYKTKRNIRKITGKELTNPKVLQEIEKIYGKEIFFKTFEKSYSEIVNINDLRNPQTIISLALSKHSDEQFIISELVDILRDDIGNKEYRVFVFENQILSISRHTEVFLHGIDYLIYAKAQEVVEQMKYTDFPSSYVVDLFEYRDREGQVQIDVVEFNGFSSSGRYLYNSIDHFPTDDLLHQNVANIAIEKRNLVNLCLIPDPKYKNYVEGFRSSNYCNILGTFANDLKKLHAFNNILNNDFFNNKFNLSRCLENYDKYEKAQIIDKPVGLDLMAELRRDARTYALQERKRNFFENLTLNECPLDESFLCSCGLPEVDEIEIPDEITIRPEVLKKLKEKYNI